MKLSPVTQYALRQLLKQHTAGLNKDRATATKVECPEFIDLNHLLNKLYPRKFEAVSKIRQLESLVTIYRQINPKNVYDYESLAEVKRRIFQLLGLRLGITSAAILPTVLPEHLVTHFTFYIQGQVRQGMRKQEKLYGLLKSVEGAQKMQIYQLAWALCEQGLPCILTLSESRYAIWVPLRSPVYKMVLEQGESALDGILRLYRRMSKLKAVAVDGVPRPLKAARFATEGLIPKLARGKLTSICVLADEKLSVQNSGSVLVQRTRFTEPTHADRATGYHDPDC